jgi:hypothetical protein
MPCAQLGLDSAAQPHMVVYYGSLWRIMLQELLKHNGVYKQCS